MDLGPNTTILLSFFDPLHVKVAQPMYTYNQLFQRYKERFIVKVFGNIKLSYSTIKPSGEVRLLYIGGAAIFTDDMKTHTINNISINL